ncbi:MAG: helix-turn-helix transcriptional regulator [Burkholderiaceae bacterium]
MDQTERFYKIETLLRQRKTVSFAALQAELEVSRSTLKRDLDYLRTRMNAPIEWSRDAGGYRFADSVEPSERPHELPGLWFSSTEIHALLTMQHLLANLDPGGLLTPHVEPLMVRLNALLGSADTEVAQLRRRVRIIGLGQRAVQPRHFQHVGTALLQRKRLHISYTARGTGEATEREVSPLRLVHYRDNWYLDAWCHLRRGLRNFAVDAIRQAHLLDTPAKEVSDAKLDVLFGPSYGIFSGKRIQWARLRFTAERARWVAHEQWHPQQQGKLQADGNYLLSIPYADHRELIMDILKHGAHCEVLGPKGLREVVAVQVKALAGKYSDELRAGSSGEPAPV